MWRVTSGFQEALFLEIIYSMHDSFKNPNCAFPSFTRTDFCQLGKRNIKIIYQCKSHKFQTTREQTRFGCWMTGSIV